MTGLRRLRRVLLVVFLLLLASTAGASYFIAQSLPQWSGTVQASVGAPVEVVRDADAIPHIFAGSEGDAFFGLGYVHAQDRLWQMEFQRRIGAGRLAEVLGKDTLDEDRFLRTLGVYRAAESAWQQATPVTKASVSAYVAGINAFLARHHGSQLPPEFTLLGFEPEPWTGPDVLVWAKMMAWDLGDNWDTELLRADLVEKVGAKRAAELLPVADPDMADGPSIVAQAGVGDRGAVAAGGLSVLVNGQAPPAGQARGQQTPAGQAASAGQARGPAPTLLSLPAKGDREIVDRARLDESGSRRPTSRPSGYAAMQAAGDDIRALLNFGTSTPGEAIGSNSWVVDGTRSASGKPLLANDPHLGLRLPSVWYLAHLSGGGLDVIGGTLPGVPGVVIGRNRRIAWGLTNLGPDVQDLFRERLDEAGTHTEYMGQWEPVQVITDTIHVKGEPDVPLQIRVTRHGPLISDAVNANMAELPVEEQDPDWQALEPLALRWTALDPTDTTADAFLNMNRATDWASFKAALKDFVAPSLNFVYADVDGNIGYYGPGRIPVRGVTKGAVDEGGAAARGVDAGGGASGGGAARGVDAGRGTAGGSDTGEGNAGGAAESGDSAGFGTGAVPAEGWSGRDEWIGWVPYEELPHVFNPPGHVIVAANNRPSPPGYAHFLGQEWASTYRARRIVERLEGKQAGEKTDPADAATAGEKLSTKDMAAIQADTVSIFAREFIPWLAALIRPTSDSEIQAFQMLLDWDGDTRADSPAAALFETWMWRLPRAIVGDELGAEGARGLADVLKANAAGEKRPNTLIDRYENQFSFTSRFLTTALVDPKNPWCDYTPSPDVEDCPAAATVAFRAALADLGTVLGPDVGKWRWDKLHAAIFPHRPLDAVALLRPLVSRRVPRGGDFSTVNVGAYSFSHPFEQYAGVSYRQVLDLADADGGAFIHYGGQSGHPFSSHYTDYLGDWTAGHFREMTTERGKVDVGNLGLLRLVPVGGEPSR